MKLPASDHRAEIAQRHYESCALCEHRCGANRSAGERGPCKAGPIPRVFRHRVECGEELELIPAHLFYLSGCDLRCAFCIAGINAFDPARGVELTSDFFNQAVAWGISQGARYLEWVGGEPTIHLPHLLKIMAQCPALPPVIWKSDFHSTPEAFALLDGVITTYVADFKFGNDQCAQRLAAVPNYVAIVTRNLKIAAGQGRLIVRHLIMPGHAQCCLEPVLQWMQKNLPDVPLSLWDGYMPMWRAGAYPEISRPLAREEAQIARELARTMNLQVIQ